MSVLFSCPISTFFTLVLLIHQRTPAFLPLMSTSGAVFVYSSRRSVFFLYLPIKIQLTLDSSVQSLRICFLVYGVILPRVHCTLNPQFITGKSHANIFHFRSRWWWTFCCYSFALSVFSHVFVIFASLACAAALSSTIFFNR